MVVAVVGTLVVVLRVVLAKYLVTAMTAEQKNSLGQMAKDATIAYEREIPGGTRGVCASASLPIPRDTASIRGRKYQSTAAEWRVDEERDAGFACLRFEVTSPRYYQYRYDATPTAVTMTAHADLDGDGRLSTTILRGEVRAGRLMVEPSMEETDPGE